MIQHFNTVWNLVPTVFIDTETTGTRPGLDAACQVALVRFENGKFVRCEHSLVNPGRDIPPEATEIHGIANDHVRDAPTLEQFFDGESVKSILKGAQPAAYNAPFDREFVAREAFEDWSWPWVDPLVVVRKVDRFAKGKGRHTLSAACERHGVELLGAHSALSDARAAGELFYRIAGKAIEDEIGDYRVTFCLGRFLLWQKHFEASQWHDFSSWLARKQDDAV